MRLLWLDAARLLLLLAACSCTESCPWAALIIAPLCLSMAWHQLDECVYFGAFRPDLVEPRRMEEFMVFSTVFLGSPHYVRNAYLR